MFLMTMYTGISKETVGQAIKQLLRIFIPYKVVSVILGTYAEWMWLIKWTALAFSFPLSDPRILSQTAHISDPAMGEGLRELIGLDHK